MNEKKRTYLILSAASLLALTSCGLTVAGNSSQESAVQSSTETTTSQAESAAITSEEETTSSEESKTSRSSVNNGHVTLTMKKDTIPAGACFFDAAKPSLIYTSADGKEEDVTNYTLMTNYIIKSKGDTSKTYAGGDALPAGKYDVEARYRSGASWRDFGELTVVEGNTEQASDGHGYRQVTTEELAPYQYQKFGYAGGMEVLGGGGTPSNGKVRLLVIPVEFSNAEAKFPQEDREAVRSVLDEAFNADSDKIGWESLRSYYLKSSHGKLEFDCTVTPIFTSTRKSTDYGDEDSSVARDAGLEAVEWLKTQIDPSTGQNFKMSDYDADKDGYIDGVEMVYVTHSPAQSTSGETNGAWWNYTFSNYGAPSVTDPGPRRTFWSRWDYVTNSYYADIEEGQSFYGKKVDAHTIVHETGHMMGAPDYYSYDHTEGPAGGVDMMDNNVGDHNAFTKMCYNWVAPKVIDGSSKDFEITLPSFTDTGDFILIPKASGWNGTPYDEFLILQYYTPTNVNEMDSKGYAEWTASGNYGHGGTYEHPGLQVFHVDNRGYETASSGGQNLMREAAHPTPESYTDDDGIRWGKTMQATSNTPSDSFDIDTKTSGEASRPADTNLLFQAVYSSSGNGGNTTWGNTWYNSFGLTSNLFGDQDFLDTYDAVDSRGTPIAYGGSCYSNYRARYFFHKALGLTFNNGDVNEWNFSVTAQTADTITLHFVNTAE